MQKFNVSGCQETVSKSKCYHQLQSTVQRIWRQRIESQLNIPVILDKYNMMIVMQKLKFMQEFTFAYAGIYFCYQCRLST